MRQLKLGYGEERKWVLEKKHQRGRGRQPRRMRDSAMEDEGLSYGVRDRMFVATMARRRSKFRPMVKPISPFPHFYTVVLYLYLDFGFAFKLHCLLT
nr:hypothetical protein CFP56_24869 [Quercus suber]